MTDSERRAVIAQRNRSYRATHRDKIREINRKKRRVLHDPTPRRPVCGCEISAWRDCECP